jgi:hypothetical protein
MLFFAGIGLLLGGRLRVLGSASGMLFELQELIKRNASGAIKCQYFIKCILR